MNRLTVIAIMICSMVGGLLVGFAIGITVESRYHQCPVSEDAINVSSPGKRLNKEQRRTIRRHNDYAKRKKNSRPKSS